MIPRVRVGQKRSFCPDRTEVRFCLPATHVRNMTQRLFGLARVSTHGQNLDRQKRALMEAGVSVDDIVVEHGISGAASVRPGLDELRLRLREGDGLVVQELSRLGRRTHELLQVVNELSGRSVTLFCLEPRLTFDGSPVANLLCSLLAATSQLERDILRQRTISGLAAARAAGRTGGRPRALTDLQRREVTRMYAGGRTPSDLAEVFGCSVRTVRRAVSGAQ